MINQAMEIMGQRGFLFYKEFFIRSMTQKQRDNYDMTSERNKGKASNMMIVKPDYLNERDIHRKREQYNKECDLMTTQLNHICSTISAIYLDEKTFGEGMILDEFHEQKLSEDSMLDYWKILRNNAREQANKDDKPAG